MTWLCRIFVGDLGNEVNDEVLQKSFQKYTSFVKGKVVRDKRTNKTKGECPVHAARCAES
jgi:RNA recognition motif-containing protein